MPSINYAQQCSGVSGLNSPIVSINAYAGTDAAIYEFTLFVTSLSTNVTANESCLVRFVSTNVPNIQMITNFDFPNGRKAFNEDEKIILTAVITTSGPPKPLTITWSSLDVDLQNTALNPLVQNIANASQPSTIQLAVSHSSLHGGVKYAFSVSAVYDEDMLLDIIPSGFASVIIAVRRSPSGGVLVANPETGFAGVSCAFTRTPL